uniref:NBS-LRR-like protein n=1 Tax=Oryza sativa subsp. indica TaxID=39946 RepID=A0A679B9K2_ORYSI|nr:NBS-LRR-like protein [Oryza sativa Indica Group]
MGAVPIGSNYTVPGTLKHRLNELLEHIVNLIDGAEKIVALANLPEITENRAHIPNRALPPRSISNPPKYVCEFEKRDDYFDLVMWIHVTENFSVEGIYREMFEAASGKKCPRYNSLDALQINLKQVLHEKRFLLVLDDIWCNKYNQGEKLEDLVRPLEAGKEGSKILATSRSTDAFSQLGPVRVDRFVIPELGRGDFRQLFMYYAVGDITTIDDRDRRLIQVIGAEIAKKLKGSPLAATIVGAQLRHKDLDYWRDYNNAREHFDDVMNSLALSFLQQLDEEVRICFAYCSMFPRKYNFERDELVKLWVTQGFINTKSGEEKEAAAQRYFESLLSALFLQPSYDDNNERCYTMHDLLYDLAKEVAGSEYFTIENGKIGGFSQDVRHLFIGIRYGKENIIKNLLELKELRTLIIDHTGLNDNEFISEIFDRVYTKLPKLRVLILKVEWFQSNMDIFFVPASIGNLRHLRYFGFRKSYKVSFRKLNLPNTFVRLHHLENEEGYELYQLKRLNKLRCKLNIHGLRNVSNKEDALEAELHKKKNLTRVKLSWYSDSSGGVISAQEEDLQSEVLEALRPPVWLQKLRIVCYKGSAYPDWMMTNGPEVPKYLQDLKLENCRPLGRKIPEHNELFKYLRKLHVFDCSWTYFPANMENLKSLQELLIHFCRNLLSLPTKLPLSLLKLEIAECRSIKKLPVMPHSLLELILSSHNQEFITSCKTPGHQYFENIRHIPRKEIEYDEDQEREDILYPSKDDHASVVQGNCSIPNETGQQQQPPR